MIDVGITKMSTKGQIVIPNDLRKDFDVGEKLVVIKNNERLIIKKASSLDKDLESDLEFARRTEEAFNRYNKGKFVEMEFDDFLDEMKTW
ncbi:MAG: AbrB/MazE/SpoVT family DNA-binding domain-containing protein [Candidatus Heimdallarchaeaceae archaeon]